jgi:sec-independent protein translocase protein TatB
VFDIGIGEMIGLAIVALLVFGPERLPKVAADAGRMLRQLRTMISGARNDLQESLGPEFKDIELSDLNPRSFVRKHLLDPIEDDGNGQVTQSGRATRGRATQHPGSEAAGANGAGSSSAEAEATPPTAPFDPDAT